ncbi:hypothetical protein SUGI_0357320 [Cryptomeria japonica]|nr:hypothetical protein SUGI_0357320 [Cryptomeria japonica]
MMKYNYFPFIPHRGSTFLPILHLLLFVINFSSVICGYIWHTCDNSLTPSDGSTYSTNLNLVTNDLFRNASQSSGFNTSSHGQSPNKVYGLIQCTGNISTVKCSNCVLEANRSIQELCANNIGGRIWLGDCFMRYHNSNFISTIDTTGRILVNVNSIPEDAFKSTISSLLSNLSNRAYIPENKGFATGSANYSASGVLYGLVQCWRDISVQDCRTCLFQARTSINNISNQGAQVQWGSCKVIYETRPFFDSAQSPSPSPEGSNPNSPTPPTASTPVLPPVVAPSPDTVNGTSTTISKERHGLSSKSGVLVQEQQFVFSLELLAEATENFHDKNKLGNEGYGAVYKVGL